MACVDINMLNVPANEVQIGIEEAGNGEILFLGLRSGLIRVSKENVKNVLRASNDGVFFPYHFIVLGDCVDGESVVCRIKRQ